MVHKEARWPNGQRAGLRIERSGSSLSRGHCVVFLAKTLYSHSASLHPGTGEFNAGSNTAMG